MSDTTEVVNNNGGADGNISGAAKTFSELTLTGKDSNETNLEYKVFVGNLSFQTTEIELKQHFMQIGTVAKANIMTYGPRSQGYGFVTFERAEDAHRAVEKLNKSALGNREINVEQAKPRSEVTTGGSRRGRGTRGKGRRGAYQYGGRDDIPVDTQSATDQGQQVEGSAEHQEVKRAESGEESEQQVGRRTRGKDSKTRGGRGGQGRGRDSLRGSFRRRRRGPPEGDLSPTTVFVANLPYELKDEELKSIFGAFNPKSAKVVTYRNGVSKGFGFVELETAEDQRNALEQMQELVLDGREIVVKVAVEMPFGNEGLRNEVQHSGSGNEDDINASASA